ncbi:MAG TPA: hypothetical protein PK997_00060 [Candidatus Omnitrophota bacterium]|jgi:CxxC-x17-CxxC domain-containing protein|nr:MAG: hypothetical protein BWY49_00685 [Candidatus Omnitrophica bacterium ADurb.Bin314]HOE68560.1 hypothetical protein [Candidatus Omnitrophota bacterium]HQB93586.1 hypothetical protein [Candidatus Omnitrophota bacterium]
MDIPKAEEPTPHPEETPENPGNRPGPDELVAAVKQLAERLETLEKKAAELSGEVRSLGSEVKRVLAGLRRETKGSSGDVSAKEPSSKQGERGPGGRRRRRERTTFKTVCAACGKECEIPFKPSSDRAVYCDACFSAHKPGKKTRAREMRETVPLRDDIAKVAAAESVFDVEPPAKPRTGRFSIKWPLNLGRKKK